MANAHWVLGAQQLAAADHPSAAQCFAAAIESATAATDPLLLLMVSGCKAMVAMLDKSDDQARDAFVRVLAEMDQAASDDAREYARQLRVALAVFSRGAPASSP